MHEMGAGDVVKIENNSFIFKLTGSENTSLTRAIIIIILIYVLITISNTLGSTKWTFG